MKDDLENVKSLGTDLMNEMRRITSDFRIGRNIEKILSFVLSLGSFVLHHILVK